MRPYLGPPWTNSCQIWCARVFHHVLVKYGHENAEMLKRKFDDFTLQYSILTPRFWSKFDWKLTNFHKLFSFCLHFLMKILPFVKMCTYLVQLLKNGPIHIPTMIKKKGSLIYQWGWFCYPFLQHNIPAFVVSTPWGNKTFSRRYSFVCTTLLCTSKKLESWTSKFLAGLGNFKVLLVLLVSSKHSTNSYPVWDVTICVIVSIFYGSVIFRNQNWKFPIPIVFKLDMTGCWKWRIFCGKMFENQSEITWS